MNIEVPSIHLSLRVRSKVIVGVRGDARAFAIVTSLVALETLCPGVVQYLLVAMETQLVLLKNGIFLVYERCGYGRVGGILDLVEACQRLFMEIVLALDKRSLLQVGLRRGCRGCTADRVFAVMEGGWATELTGELGAERLRQAGRRELGHVRSVMLGTRSWCRRVAAAAARRRRARRRLVIPVEVRLLVVALKEVGALYGVLAVRGIVRVSLQHAQAAVDALERAERALDLAVGAEARVGAERSERRVSERWRICVDVRAHATRAARADVDEWWRSVWARAAGVVRRLKREETELVIIHASHYMFIDTLAYIISI